MSNRTGFIGAYLAPQLKGELVERAQSLGMTNTEYLTDVLIREMDANLVPNAAGFAAKAEFEPSEMLEESVFEHLNTVVITSMEGYDEAEPNFTHLYLNDLALSLEAETKTPHLEDDPEDDHFRDVLPAKLSDLLYGIIEEVYDELAEDAEKSIFFKQLSTRLQEELATLKAAPTILNFAGEEKAQLEALRQQFNQGRSEPIPTLEAFLRHQLGELLVEEGQGLFVDRFPEMVRVGEKMQRA